MWTDLSIRSNNGRKLSATAVSLDESLDPTCWYLSATHVAESLGAPGDDNNRVPHLPRSGSPQSTPHTCPGRPQTRRALWTHLNIQIW